MYIHSVVSMAYCSHYMVSIMSVLYILYMVLCEGLYYYKVKALNFQLSSDTGNDEGTKHLSISSSPSHTSHLHTLTPSQMSPPRSLISSPLFSLKHSTASMDLPSPPSSVSSSHTTLITSSPAAPAAPNSQRQYNTPSTHT